MSAVAGFADCRSQTRRTSRGRCVVGAATHLDSGRHRAWHPVSERPGRLPAGPCKGIITRLPQLSLHSPVGDLTISDEDGAIVALDWGWGRDQTETPLLVRARGQLQEYFDGARLEFDLPLAPAGTPYRRRVWEALRQIPPAETRSYAEIARTVGGSPLAVGSANAANPIPILIPCHRVVATNGIGGYSGGDGLKTKRYLLALELRALQAAERRMPA